jgi:hypothetical protein
VGAVSGITGSGGGVPGAVGDLGTSIPPVGVTAGVYGAAGGATLPGGGIVGAAGLVPAGV